MFELVREKNKTAARQNRQIKHFAFLIFVAISKDHRSQFLKTECAILNLEAETFKKEKKKKKKKLSVKNLPSCLSFLRIYLSLLLHDSRFTYFRSTRFSFLPSRFKNTDGTYLSTGIEIEVSSSSAVVLPFSFAATFIGLDSRACPT